MLEIASQMIICLLLAALLGFIIGYLFSKMGCTKKEQKISNTPNTSSKQTEALSSSHADKDKPVLLSSPRNGKKDNLTLIKGIGIKIEKALNDIGIYHFDQIAAWDEENISWADSTLGFPGRAKREEWVSQAKALASGEETEFSKRVTKGEVATSKKG